MIWIPPIITACLFAMSGICGQRTTALMDPMWANLTRLTFASLCLALIAAVTGGWHLHNTALPWFALSGLVGFGLGDIGLFLAYACIGARLTLLIGLCLAPVFALMGEWVIFHQAIRSQQGVAIVVTLLGVALAITGNLRLVDRNHDVMAWALPWRLALDWGKVWERRSADWQNRMLTHLSVPLLRPFNVAPQVG